MRPESIVDIFCELSLKLSAFGVVDLCTERSSPARSDYALASALGWFNETAAERQQSGTLVPCGLL
jgi:hypothetical protein